MSLHENSSVKPPVERSAADKTAEYTQTGRLYPSLPVSRYDAFIADGSVEGKLSPAAVLRSGSLPGNTQFDASVGSGEAAWKAKVRILEEQKQELLSINEKWAKEYRTMRQYYKEKVQGLKALLQHDFSQFEEEPREGGDRNRKLKFKTVETNKSTLTGDADISCELLRAEKEAKELREQNNTLTRRVQHQNEEIKRLNKALQEALQNTQPLEMSLETLHEVWKHQAEVYKEDFLKERKDREKLKEKFWDLEKKYRKVYRELHVFKSQATQLVPECHCTTPPKSPNWEVQHINQRHMVLQRR